MDDEVPPPQRGVSFPPLPGPGKAAKWMFAPCMAPYAKLDVPVEKMAFLLCRQKHLNECDKVINKCDAHTIIFVRNINLAASWPGIEC